MSTPREAVSTEKAAATAARLLLTIAEAAAALNVPENWLRKKVSARAVPFTRIGRHVRFTDAHLEQIIRDGEQPPISLVSDQGLSRRSRRAS